ncbi:FkbM family methyltransferase [Nostocales cyanobacterium LEGE 12452]|nr:FkbM family methyltransferase [Nostocales cyanobacterium LEGE 12452]
MLMKTEKSIRRYVGITWRLFRGFQKVILRVGRPVILSNSYLNKIPLEKLGSKLNGWQVPIEYIKDDWICYCFGVGRDATFDMALVDKFGCQVFSFDPTPTALKYMEDLNYNNRLMHFYPWGIWKEDTQIKFYAAVSSNDSNFSVFDLHGSGDYVTAECYTLSSIMRKLNHKKIDLLKIDIEGSWYEVLKQIIKDGIQVSVLCVEFDSPVSLTRVKTIVDELTHLGLSIVSFEKNNYVFVNNSLLSESV